MLKRSLVKKIFGLTLLELVIVIVIVGILATIAITRYGNITENARKAEAYTVLSEIVSAEKRYQLENDAYTSIWGYLDTFESAPVSNNFTFSLDATSKCANATKLKGTTDYYMCFETGKQSPGSTCSCP